MIDFRMGYLPRLAMELATGAAGLSTESRRRGWRFVARHVAPDGGFTGRSATANETPNDAKTWKIATSPADAYYTSFGLRCLAMLGADEPEATEIVNACSDFLHRMTRTAAAPPVAENADSDSEQKGDSWGESDGDFLFAEPLAECAAWFQSAAMIEAMTGRFPISAGTRREWFTRRTAPLRRPDGGFALASDSPESSTYATFLVLSTAELFDPDPAPQNSPPTPSPFEQIGKTEFFSIDFGKIAAMLAARQNADGGFSELASLGRSGTSPTAAAIALLRMVSDHPNTDECVNTMQCGVFGGLRYLLSIQNPDGGFPAHPQLPCADLLSSLTALVALRDIAWLTRSAADRFTEPQRAKIERLIGGVHAPLRRFAASLETPDGGFRSMTLDADADIEYTFYGLATLALTTPATNDET